MITRLPSTYKIYFTLFLSVFVATLSNAAIGLRGTSTANSTNTSLTILKPAGVLAGDLMIITIAQNGTAGLSNPTCAGWTLIDGANLGGGTNRWGAVLYKMAGAAEPANYTFT